MHNSWLQFANETEANDVISTINTCMGYPTPDGKTTTWGTPLCYQDGYSPTATTESFFVIVREEIQQCLTQEQWDGRLHDIPTGWVPCGDEKPDNSPESYVGN